MLYLIKIANSKIFLFIKGYEMTLEKILFNNDT